MWRQRPEGHVIISMNSRTLSFVLIALAAASLSDQIPDTTGVDVVMGRLHVLVDEANGDAHRKAGIERINISKS